MLQSHSNPKSKSIIHKALRQGTGEANESTVFVEGQKVRALIGSGSQLSSISVEWVKKLKLNLQYLHSVLQTEGLGGSDVPYLGYVEAHLKIPEVSAFDTDVPLLIVPDSMHTACAAITLGTLHTDMGINLAPKAGLKVK